MSVNLQERNGFSQSIVCAVSKRPNFYPFSLLPLMDANRSVE
jgi:hypothetical protein